MAVITAAVIGAVGAVGAAAITTYGSQGGGGGGGGGNPQFKQAPADPLDQAMRSYYARATIMNADKTYPSFGAFTTSGGDPAMAKFDLDLPGMTPKEAAAFGIVGRHGETIPTASFEDLASGRQKNLTPEQILYLARQRKREATQQGQPVGKWAADVLGTNRRLGRTERKLEALQAIEQPGPRRERRMTKLEERKQRLQYKQQGQLNPG